VSERLYYRAQKSVKKAGEKESLLFKFELGMRV
jgi:hypothetical protein